jgi:hypothetical protein
LLAPTAWICLAPIGFAFGAAFALIQNERAQSSLTALMEGRRMEPPARAPLAPLFHRLIEARSPRRGALTILGSDWRTGQRVAISDQDRNRHILIAGTTGAGKTNSLLNLVEASAGVGTVIIDGKGDIELATKVLAFAEARGQKTYLFEPTGTLPSAVYNPLATGDYTSLADRIVTLREWSEPHYLKLAEGFAQTTFKVLQTCNVRVDLLSVADALDVDHMLVLLRKNGKLIKTFKLLAEEVASLRDSEEHIEGLRAEVRNLSRSVFRNGFDTQLAQSNDTPVINLKTTRDEKALVYFCLPALVYPQRAEGLGKLIVNDIKFVTSTARTPWNIMLDEFSIFAGPQVLNLINQGRSYGLSVTLATQSIADIAHGAIKDGDKFVDQIFGSVNTYIIHRLNSANDCELIAGVAGTELDVEYTAQTLGGIGTGAASARHTRQFAVHPDAIKRLPVGTAFFINKNNSYIRHIKARKSRIG